MMHAIGCWLIRWSVRSAIVLTAEGVEHGLGAETEAIVALRLAEQSLISEYH